MFAIQNAIKYTEKNIGRYLFLWVIVLVIIVTLLVVLNINEVNVDNITVIDTIELICDIKINENDGVSVYKLTVIGYLESGEAYIEQVPSVVSRTFDLITDGTVESIHNIILSARINGGKEDIKYDVIYAFLEKVDIDGGGK